jgi:folate-dependent phosphoribosylglycinamide formyltransferase PurN
MSNRDDARIVFMTGGGPLYWIIANELADHFGPFTIIREHAEPKGLFLKRRIRRLGAVTVMGQVAFSFLSKLIAKRSQAKVAQIIADTDSDAAEPTDCTIVDVESVNGPDAIKALQSVNPDVVMVVGTRILKARTLMSIGAPFINYHPGLTPKYRGMNGAYWTLASNDADNLAVTLHLVDEHVDTGGILYQARCTMPPGNNITTYHYQLAAEARPWAVKAVEDALNHRLKPIKSDLPSKQWYHPTLWGYLWTGLTRGVW